MTKKKTLTEKQVVDYIIDNWDRLFSEHGIRYRCREKSPVSWWRVDLWGTIDMDLQEMKITNRPYPYKASVFIEAKFRSESRDLIYELQKGLDFLSRIEYPNFIGVLSDNFDDPTIIQFIQDHNIHMFKIEIEDDDLDTIQIKYYEPGMLIIEDQ